MKKIITQDGRLFGLINIIDLIAILLVAMLALVFYMKQTTLAPIVSSLDDTSTLTYTFQVPEFYDAYLENLAVGDTLFDDSSKANVPVGTITDIEISPAIRYTAFPDGTVKKVLLEDYSALLITLEAPYTILNDRFMIYTGYDLGINVRRNLHSPYVTLTGQVMDIHDINS